jgi:hypothetical protein
MMGIVSAVRGKEELMASALKFTPGKFDIVGTGRCRRHSEGTFVL